MLLADQRKPLAPREFFMDGEVVMLRDFPDVFGLVMENSGENRNSTVLQHTIEFREERKDDVCREISHQQMHGVLSNGVKRSAKRPDVIFAVAIDVRMRDLHGVGIDIAGKNVLCSQKPRGDRQDSRTGPDIEHDMMRLDPSLQWFYCDHSH